MKKINEIKNIIKMRQKQMQNQLVPQVFLINKNKNYCIMEDVFGLVLKKYNIQEPLNQKAILNDRLGLNLALGKSCGYWIRLELVGVGYKAEINNETHTLSLKLGRVLEDRFQIPSNICIFIVRTRIYIFGPDKDQVSQIANQIRNIKAPDIYQGKGIRFYKEDLILKKSRKKKAK